MISLLSSAIEDPPRGDTSRSKIMIIKDVLHVADKLAYYDKSEDLHFHGRS